MELVYGNLEVSGDFQLINVKELGFDRDFIISPQHQVVNLITSDFPLQFTRIRRILLRASLAADDATVHFLSDTDLASAAANFTFNAARFKLELQSAKGSCEIRLIAKKSAGLV